MERIEPQDWPQAVARTDGPQLVVSGPGAGKTEFLVRRALHLIEGGLAPEELLLLSFSRRSAADLRQRIEAGIETSFTTVAASTFHALAARLLEAYAPQVLGWSAVPTLLTGPEHVDLVANLLSSEDPERWPLNHRGMLKSRTFAAEVTDFLQRCRELRITPDELEERVAARSQWRGLDTFLTRYDGELDRVKRIDYGTLQARAVEVLSQPEVAAEVAAAHPYILVDEFQDTTRIQAEMLRLLYERHRNLTVTGDPYQAIYSFRGADPSNLTQFAEAFPDADGTPAQQFSLTTSFRVRQEVLRAAERVTAGGAIPEVAGPVSPAPGPSSVEVYAFTQQSEEAEWIAQEAERLHLVEAIPYSSMAVVVRTKRRILSELSRAFDRRGIRHDRPDVRSVDLPAIRVVVDAVIAATESGDDQVSAVRRLLLGPLYGMTLGRWRQLERGAAGSDDTWAAHIAAEVGSADRLAGLLSDTTWATEMPAAEGFWHLWSQLDGFDVVVAASDPSDRRALASLAQVLGRFGERNPEATLRDYVALVESEEFEARPLLGFRPPDEDRLTLTTMHQAKGLEFDVVFIADAVDEIIPDLRPRDSLLDTRLLDDRQPVDPAEYALARLREEMRLAYTAMCRASYRVVWTATAAGVAEDHGAPSRFLTAIGGPDLVLEPPTQDTVPATPRAQVALLRRTLRDATARAVERLSALGALVERGDLPRLAFGTLQHGPDTGLIPPDHKLSPSQAEAFDTCPRRYALERRLHIGDERTVYLLFGSLIHTVLERAEGEALQSGEPMATLQQALQHLDAEFDPMDFGGEPWATGWRSRAEALLTKLYENWPRGSLPVVAIEHGFETDLGGHRWRGFADRIEGDGEVIRIVDYKTSSKPKSVAEGEESLQLAFYALAADRDDRLEGEVTGAALWYPALRSSKSVTVRKLDMQRLGELEERLIGACDGILAEEWQPNPGDQCERCRVRQLCPAWAEGAEAFA